MKTKSGKIARRTRQRKVPATGIDDDRLSSLPDEIITHILSYLQTKYAVVTAVLSRRWKNLWTRVSSLDFDNRSVYKPLDRNVASPAPAPVSEILRKRDMEFRRFVDRVLSRHENLDSLSRFRFHFSAAPRDWKIMPGLGLNRFHFSAAPREWKVMPDFAFNTNSLVEEIDVMISGETEFELLRSMFCTSKNLKVVKLEGVILSAPKGSFSLPGLKILQLRGVETEDCESLSNFVSGSHVLETVHLENCYSRNEGRMLMRSLPSLKNLKIICGYAVLEDRNLREFPGLMFLDSVPLPCLHSAYVDVGSYRSSDYCLIGLLTAISNAKKLHLSGETLSLLSSDTAVQLPIFPNLTHLTIGTGGRSWVLHSLLHSASKLRSLVIDMGHPIRAMKWERLDTVCVPSCLSLSLEEIEIRDLVADEGGMEMIAYLLKAGVALKKVSMHVYEGLVNTRNHKGLVSLLNLPRGSSSCEARFLLPDNREIDIDSYHETSTNEYMDDDDF